MMPLIRLPEADWERVWECLVETGPISRNTREPIYFVSEEQVKVLQKRRLPFEIVPQNGQQPKGQPRTRHG